MLWQTRDHLSELGTARRASSRVVRHSLTWRKRRDPVVRAQEDTAHLDSLAASCQTATRTTLAAEEEDRSALAPVIAELARVTGDPGSRDVRQHAEERVATAGDQLPSLLGAHPRAGAGGGSSHCSSSSAAC